MDMFMARCGHPVEQSGAGHPPVNSVLTFRVVHANVIALSVSVPHAPDPKSP